MPHGEMGVEGVILKNQPHAPVFRREVGHVVVPKQDPAGCGSQQTGNQVEGSAFAAARRAQQTDEFAVGDLKIKIVHGGHCLAGTLAAGGELLCYVLQYDFHGHSSFSSDWVRGYYCVLFSHKIAQK